MSKAICPAGCGKKFVTSEHAMSHADLMHPNWIEERNKRKGWATPYGFVDFSYPVSYEFACSEAQKHMAAFVWPEDKDKTVSKVQEEKW